MANTTRTDLLNPMSVIPITRSASLRGPSTRVNRNKRISAPAIWMNRLSTFEESDEVDLNWPPGFLSGSVGQIAPNFLDEALNGLNKLTFRRNEKITLKSGSMIVQILGVQNEIVMTITHLECMTLFTDRMGTVQMTSQDQMIAARDRIIGYISGEGSTKCCSSALEAYSSSDDLLFTVVNLGSIFNFVANNTTIATARKIVADAQSRKTVVDGLFFGLELAESLDGNTRAMIIATAYYLYVLHYTELNCCGLGSVPIARMFHLVPFGICVLVIIAIIITVYFSVST